MRKVTNLPRSAQLFEDLSSKGIFQVAKNTFRLGLFFSYSKTAPAKLFPRLSLAQSGIISQIFTAVTINARPIALHSGWSNLSFVDVNQRKSVNIVV